MMSEHRTRIEETMKLCSECGEPIPKARLEAMPNTTLCVPCKVALGDEPPKLGHMVFNHKTGGVCEIVSPQTLNEINRLDRRGYKHRHNA
jgi:hypothetical protein